MKSSFIPHWSLAGLQQVFEYGPSRALKGYRMRKLRLSRQATTALLALGLACGSGPAAWAAGNVERGKAVAQQQCTNCHVIRENETNTVENPPFGPDFMSIRGLTAAQLKARLSKRHPIMPKFARITDRQIEDLVAYIASVKM